MIFQPEHAEDISYVYEANQTFESVSNLYATKRIFFLPVLYVFLPVLLIKKVRIAVFLWTK